MSTSQILYVVDLLVKGRSFFCFMVVLVVMVVATGATVVVVMIVATGAVVLVMVFVFVVMIVATGAVGLVMRMVFVFMIMAARAVVFRTHSDTSLLDLYK